MLKERIEHYWAAEKRQFLLDGFPRSIGQAEEFEKKVGPGLAMLLFDAPEETRRERVVGRGRVSDRAEDNAADFWVRNERFARLSPPVVGMFERRGRLEKVDCQQTEENVYRKVQFAVRMLVEEWHPEFL
ncbi:MAG: hypothetical protein LQ347_005874 [Umbilicaria vellea]|nr:MAG: hypothetical protein LQ347_005874 [Umbilicaria vellea]